MSSLGQLHSLLLRAEQLMFVTLKCHYEILMHSIHFQKSRACFHLEGISDKKVFLFSRSWVPNPWQAAFLALPQDQPAVLNLEEKIYIQQTGINGLAIRYISVPRTGKASEQKCIQAQGMEKQEAPNQPDSEKRQMERFDSQA